jgi:membrane protein implicated in regulation of membrane protease activity
MFAPGFFFFNFAISGLFTALFAYKIHNLFILVPIFVLISLASLIFLRPILAAYEQNEDKDKKTGVDSKYIGQIAKVSKAVNKNEGVVEIYNERWEARTLDGFEGEITVGSNVRIVKNESLVLYVEPVDE